MDATTLFHRGLRRPRPVSWLAARRHRPADLRVASGRRSTGRRRRAAMHPRQGTCAPARQDHRCEIEKRCNQSDKRRRNCINPCLPCCSLSAGAACSGSCCFDPMRRCMGAKSRVEQLWLPAPSPDSYSGDWAPDEVAAECVASAKELPAHVRQCLRANRPELL